MERDMERFEYDISTHGGNAFRKVAYFCSREGECSVEDVPAEGSQILADLMNERGVEGWELVQFVFGKDGIVAFWKRRLLSG